jgi:hypothetical protein
LQYLAVGRNEKTIDFRVKHPTQPNINIPVRLKLLYFPFEDGDETLPWPSPRQDEAPPPLELRNPGVEVFWNDRLIKGDTLSLLDTFAFARPGQYQGQKLEKQWYMRVKAMMFVNSMFPVTHSSKQ